MDDDSKKQESAGKVRPPARIVEEVVDEKAPAEDDSGAPPHEAEIVSNLKQEMAEPKPTSAPIGSLPQQEEVTEDAQEEKPPKNIKLFVVIVLIVAVFVILLGGGIYVYLTGTNKTQKPKEETQPVSTSTPTPTFPPSPSPSPTELPQKELSSYKIEVLNGSGLIGAASKVKDLIEKNGFKVSEVGNASSYDFERTQIQVKKNVPEEVVDKLKELLGKSYTLEMGDNLEDKSSFDIVITVGLK